ncbi:hypothetical protein [Pseudoduganella sp.]|uniref:hypothetical protein n=1 Tax=Pseudoduganella sp. TaxID=1880898 RepID=UPI0035AEE46F
MKKKVVVLLAASISLGWAQAETKKCVPRIEQFKNLDQLIGYEGKCLEALAMGEDRTRECGGVATSIVQSDGKRMFVFQAMENIRWTYIGTPGDAANVENEQHYVLGELMISNSDQGRKPVLAKVDPGGACIVRSAVNSGHELECSATLSELRFAFSIKFKASAPPDIDNICK